MQNEFLLHWLTFTVFDKPDKALWLAMRIMGFDGVLPFDVFSLIPSGGRGYTEVYTTSESVRVYQKPSDETDRYTIEIPGEVLITIDWRVIQTVFQELNLSGIRWQITRCDYAFDLHESGLTPENLRSYLRMGGAVRSPSERAGWLYRAPTMLGVDGIPDNAGVTLTFGSRASGRYVRIYDLHGFTRVEMETKGKVANHLFRVMLIDMPSIWSKIAVGFLLDFLDFPENFYWKEFVGGCLRVRMMIKTHITIAIQRSIDWLNKQVAPTMYMLAELYGMGSLMSLVLASKDRMSPRQESMVKLKPVLNFF
jgi:DNA relaxase NicK